MKPAIVSPTWASSSLAAWATLSLLAAVLAALAGLSVLPTAAQEGARIGITPPVLDVGVGSTFTVTVGVADVVDLGAFQVTLDYVDTHLEFLAASPGSFLGSTGRKVVPVGPVTSTGQVTFGAYSEPGAPGPSGSGDLARLRFRALTEAETPLELLAPALTDAANNPITVVQVGGGLVYVGPPRTPAPPTPTAAPTVPVYLPLVSRR